MNHEHIAILAAGPIDKHLVQFLALKLPVIPYLDSQGQVDRHSDPYVDFRVWVQRLESQHRH